MYVLFWRVCNATSQFTFRKAMERVQKEGGDKVIEWLGQLGDPSTWSKHKFDPNVCNDSNTSNFVESFNSTLGIDRCRPVLTLLEGKLLLVLCLWYACAMFFLLMFDIFSPSRNQESVYG